MAAVMLFLRQTTGKTERHTHFCISLEPVFTRDCGGRVHFTDEPTGALDSHAARQLLDTFAMLCREFSATILMVTHDVMAASYCDRILFMKDGEIKTSLNREQENKQTFFADILKQIEWIEGESHDVFEAVNP